MTTSSFVASTLHKKCNDIFLLTSHSFKSGEQFRKCFMIVLHNWNSEHSEQGSVSKTLVFIFFISVFSLTLAEQGTMNTNKITNKQNIVVDITVFYILVFAISGGKNR